jgi:DNA repair protein RecO
MERFSELSIILKNFPYQERDRIAVCFTENRGRVTGLAKGGVSSKRYGGALDFLACSRVQFTQKPHAELARIDEAVSHHEFKRLQGDFERLTAASFAAEFCLRLVEPGTPARDIFLILSNALFQLDAGMPLRLAVNAFLCKTFKAMGYPPSLLRCVACAKGAHELVEDYFWLSEAGGMICRDCSNGRAKLKLEAETLLFYHELTMKSFKDLSATYGEKRDPDGRATLYNDKPHAQLYRLLADFLHHHIPGLPADGLKSWQLLNDAMIG